MNPDKFSRILATTALFLALTAPAATFLVAWDNNPISDAVSSYRLYSLTSTNRTLIGSSATNLVSATLATGFYQLNATALNIAGMESDLSIPLYIVVGNGTNVNVVNSKPSAPLNLRLGP